MWLRAAVLLLVALPVQAEVPLSSLRPMPRPEITPLPPAPLTVAVPILRPKPRPAGLAQAAAPPQPVAQPQPTAQPDASIRRMSSVRPPPRPDNLVTASLAPAPSVSQPEPEVKPEPRPSKRKKKASQKGSVCGVAAIKGEEVARVTSKVKGCGIEDPVRITSVSGVRLSQPATLDCDTAKALNSWVEAGLQPAFGRTQVVEMRIAAHYICRSRNNIKGAKVSEHGRGKAIDIAGVTLANGKTVSVLGGYGKELRRAYKSACGIFGTTLGPGSDGFHEDHLHFDTASHRSGPYCR